MAKDPEQVLTRRWIHSHEEDTPSEMVFRPASFDFPRARGRDGFELRPDQSMMEVQPGAADRGEETPGKWELQLGKKLLFFKPGSKEPARTLKIVSADKDRLVIARKTA